MTKKQFWGFALLGIGVLMSYLALQMPTSVEEWAAMQIFAIGVAFIGYVLVRSDD